METNGFSNSFSAIENIMASVQSQINLVEGLLHYRLHGKGSDRKMSDRAIVKSKYIEKRLIILKMKLATLQDVVVDLREQAKQIDDEMGFV